MSYESVHGRHAFDAMVAADFERDERIAAFKRGDYFRAEARRVLAIMKTQPRGAGWEQNRRYVRRMVAEVQRRVGAPQ